MELTLRKPEAGEPDFADAALLKRLVKRYSDFVPTPIELAGETLNSMTPLWTKPAKDITPEEHAGFYRRLGYAVDGRSGRGLYRWTRMSKAL